MINQQTPANEPTAEDYWADCSQIFDGNRIITEAMFKHAIRKCQSDTQEYADRQTAKLRAENAAKDKEIETLEREALELKAGQEYLKKELNRKFAEWENQRQTIEAFHNSASRIPNGFWERLQTYMAGTYNGAITKDYILSICKNNINP